MKQYQNQSYDQKKGSADQCVTGEKQGMPGAEIGRGSMASTGHSSVGGSSNARGSGGNADYGGPEGNSRERKTARNGSDSNAG